MTDCWVTHESTERKGGYLPSVVAAVRETVRHDSLEWCCPTYEVRVRTFQAEG